MKMTTEEAFVKTLQRHGIEHAFGIIGSAMMPISDLFPKAGINFWDCAHEGSAGMMSDGYTRATGKMSMMIAQNGPGITNFVTAVKTAYWNHTPLLLVTPQAANKTIGQGGFQEVEQMKLFEDMVAYQEEVRDPSRVAETLNRVILQAKRLSAPAQLNIPRDFWTQIVDIEIPEILEFERPAGGESAITAAAALLSNAKNPVILNGAGVVLAGAIPASMALAERLSAPVCVGYQHNDAFPGSHPLFAGPLGYNGSKAGMDLIADADVVLCLGTRLNPFSTLPGYGIDYWPKDAKIIQVDLNPDRIGLTKKVTVGIVGDAKKVATSILEQLSDTAGDEGRDTRTAKIAQTKSQWAQQLSGMDHEDDDPGTTWNQRARADKPNWMSPRMAWRAIQSALPREAIISSDIGNNCAIGNAYPSFDKGRKYLAPGLFGPCGYGLPAIVGAKIGQPDVPVVGFAGDGAFGIAVNELTAIGRSEWPAITMVVFRNYQWGAEKRNSTLWFDDNFVGTELDDGVSYAGIAQACSLQGVQTRTMDELTAALNTAITDQMQNGKTTLIEVLINQELGEPFRRDAMKKPVSVAGISADDMQPQKICRHGRAMPAQRHRPVRWYDLDLLCSKNRKSSTIAFAKTSGYRNYITTRKNKSRLTMQKTRSPMPRTQPDIDLSPPVSDEIRKTTCYMCACRCGINVHLKDGKVAYIEGNRDHPVNKGVLCAKGSAGIMQVNAPSRLRAPLKRVGPRGSGEFEEISWDEALNIATKWLAPIRKNNPEKLAFFTGRDQSQSFTSFWAQNFGTPNYAAHGGFCSVNMAAAGIYTMGGAFWEFGQPDWDHTKLFLLFGVAEDHDSNPIKMGLGKIKARGARVIGVNPIRTGYNAIADDWVGITPGTDGLFILALVHLLMKAGKIDLDYLARYTNAPVLVNSDPNSPEYGLFLRDENGKELVKDRDTGQLTAFDQPGVRPDLSATHHSNGITHRPVFHMMADRYLSDEYAPEAVSERCGITAAKIRTIAAEIARVAFDEAFELDIEWTDFRGETHKTMTGRPVSFHSMRGVSAHANGFQTCRALHVLQIILGTVEAPGGFRFKPPYPKPATAHPKPHCGVKPDCVLDGPHLGFVQGPDDLALKPDGTPARIDKAFTWENPMSSHGLMHMVISNAHAGDPYKIDTLFMYMANMSWNSSMNTKGVMEMLTDTDENGEYVIPHIIYSDAYSSEMVAYADLILPDTTYLERHDCISLLDRPICEADAAADAIRWPVIEPDRDVRGFQSVLCELGARLDLPGFVTEDGAQKYADYGDYIINHQRKPGIGPLAGFRGDGNDFGRGDVNPDQLNRYIKNGGFAVSHIPKEASYFKPWNMAYQNWAVKTGLFDSPTPYLFQLYVEPLRKFQLAAEGHGNRQPPDHLRAQIKATMDPLPIWYETDQQGNEGFTVNALTQRPMAMYHSWGSQNAWLRQLHGRNPLYVPTRLMRENSMQDGDWAKVSSPHGDITVPVMEMAALNDNTVWTWNAIGKRKGTWALKPDASEATEGFLLNHLIHELLPPKGDGLRWANSDPITGQAAWFDLKVKIEKTSAPTESQPVLDRIGSPVAPGPDQLTWKVGK